MLEIMTPTYVTNIGPSLGSPIAYCYQATPTLVAILSSYVGRIQITASGASLYSSTDTTKNYCLINVYGASGSYSSVNDFSSSVNWVALGAPGLFNAVGFDAAMSGNNALYAFDVSSYNSAEGLTADTSNNGAWDASAPCYCAFYGICGLNYDYTVPIQSIQLLDYSASNFWTDFIGCSEKGS